MAFFNLASSFVGYLDLQGVLIMDRILWYYISLVINSSCDHTIMPQNSQIYYHLSVLSIWISCGTTNALLFIMGCSYMSRLVGEGRESTL